VALAQLGEPVRAPLVWKYTMPQLVEYKYVITPELVCPAACAPWALTNTPKANALGKSRRLTNVSLLPPFDPV
jgi:hypothetical protein